MSSGHTRSRLDPAVVGSTVTGLPGWPFGPIRVERMIRIGAEHGLSGTAHRVIARTATRERVTFVVKEDPYALVSDPARADDLRRAAARELAAIG